MGGDEVSVAAGSCLGGDCGRGVVSGAGSVVGAASSVFSVSHFLFLDFF